MKNAPTDYAADFQTFWQRYPLKVGKLAAQKVYEKVRRSGISQEELLDGIAQYIATKPAWQAWAHPRTWISQGRWLDELAVKPSVSAVACQHTPPCPSRWAHGQLEQAEASGDPELVAGLKRLYAKSC